MISNAICEWPELFISIKYVVLYFVLCIIIFFIHLSRPNEKKKKSPTFLRYVESVELGDLVPTIFASVVAESNSKIFA